MPSNQDSPTILRPDFPKRRFTHQPSPASILHSSTPIDVQQYPYMNIQSMKNSAEAYVHRHTTTTTDIINPCVMDVTTYVQYRYRHSSTASSVQYAC